MSGPMTTSAVIRDPALPGLETAMRGEIAPCLSAALGAASNGEWSLLSATPVRFRYRPGKRAIVQYTLTFLGLKGEFSTPAALWFFAGGKAAKLARKVTFQGLDNSAPPPAVLDPATGGLLQIFPYDYKVPQLAAFLREPGAYAPDLLGAAADPADAPELVRFRPGLGATFRWRRPGGPQVYVKIYPGVNSADALVRLESLHRAAPPAGFATPRVVGSAEKIAAIAVEGIEGPYFGGILATGRIPEIQDAAQRAARALAGLHRCRVAVSSEIDRGAFVQRATAAATSIGTICPTQGKAARHLAGWITRTTAPLRLSLTHMDVKPEHLIVTDDAITLLDVDNMARSDGLYDVAMLEMRIHSAFAAGNCKREQAKAAIRALLEAYSSPGDPGFTRRYTWLRACAALQVAKHYAQNPSDRWRECTAKLLHAGRPDIQPNRANPATAFGEGSA